MKVLIAVLALFLAATGLFSHYSPPATPVAISSNSRTIVPTIKPNPPGLVMFIVWKKSLVMPVVSELPNNTPTVLYLSPDATVAVDMAKFPDKVFALWYSLKKTYTIVGPGHIYANKGTRLFSPPGSPKNFVLVLESAPPTPAPPRPQR